jgi:epoxyqueuosine reductase
LATSQTWSNWSPYRLGRPLPETKPELDALCIQLQKSDPQMQDVTNSFNNYRQAVFDPDWFYYTVCGYCRSVCAPSREDRLANRKLIINSGTAALKLNGAHVLAGENVFEVRTPFGLYVIVPQKEQPQARKKKANWPGQFPLDRAVIDYLCQHYLS